MRLAFAGTPDFAAAVLAALIDNGLKPEFVLTQPDRAQGRGLKLAASPVKQLASAHHIPVLQPPTLKTADAHAPLLAQPLDVLVVAAYGLILPQPILDWPRFGCLNVHASLLPRWRGAAPIQHALLAGDTQTGITLMQMDAGLDTGAMIATREVPISPDDTTGSLHDALASAGAALAVDVLRQLEKNGALTSVPQDNILATYASKIDKSHARIDWTQDAATIERAIRAFNPVPGAYLLWNGMLLKLWRAVLLPDATTATPGTVLTARPQGIDVACRTGVLRILELQPAGGKRQTAAAFLAGHSLLPGCQLG
ncbi:MAG: methionyl-tRNA formyltransferase [Burkholderiales bacterium]|jgi:methionyl-tRNA formyltransferase|nr:methionyl-tRNA formyltransferase [Burkholderiales bacterium]